MKHDINDAIVQAEEPFLKVQRIISEEFHINMLEHDPGKCLQIWEYSMSQKDEIGRVYLKWGSYQIQLENYLFFLRKNIQSDFNLIDLKIFLLS